jgi:glycerol-3-phosphate dehydrogenase
LSATAHWDGQLVDDARLVVSVARTAARYGARILTRARALQVTGDGARVGVAQGGEIDIRARHVIVATGVWTTELDPQTHLTASRGSHVVLRPEALGHARAALTVQVPGDRSRYVFALPTVDGPVIAGITDHEVSGPIPAVPAAPDDDIAWILEHLSSALSRPLGSSDVIGTYAGLRPLVGRPGEPSADISRRHLVERRPEGHVVVTGGKLTTYRRMAQDAVDALGVGGACVTASLPLVGAQPRSTPDVPGVSRHLRDRYGAEAPRLIAHAKGDPMLLAPLADGVPTLGVEIVHAIRCEGALSPEDVLERRTRLSVIPRQCEAARQRADEIIESLT